MKKSIIFKIHSFTGLIVGLFLFLLSISGAALVFHEELDKWQFPAFTINSQLPIVSVDSSYRSVQKNFPHAQISNAVLSKTLEDPYLFTIYDSSYRLGKEPMQLLLHPQTAAIIGKRGSGNDLKGNFMSWLSVFHNSFHLKQKGEWLLGVLSVLFLVSIISGIIHYRKKIWPVLMFRKAIYNRHHIHQIIGVYALLFNLMIAGSGFWMQRYVFKKDFYAEQGSYERILKASPPLFFSLDTAFEKAKEREPDFTGHVIYFAQKKSNATAVYGSLSTNSFIHSKKLADYILLDSTGQISKTGFVKEIVAENRRDIINAQIHYGKYGGLPVKILYCLFGLSGAILSISGFILWKNRK